MEIDDFSDEFSFNPKKMAIEGKLTTLMKLGTVGSSMILRLDIHGEEVSVIFFNFSQKNRHLLSF